MSTLQLTEDELVHVTCILLAAAHADMRYDGTEAEVIVQIIEVLARQKIPASIQEIVNNFDIDGFSLEEACQGLDFDEPRRDALFALIGRVIEADDVVDFDESEFFKRVAEHLGATASEVDPYLVRFIELTPPPLP